METLLAGAEAFFHGLWRTSWQASFVILLVLVAQWVMKRQLNPWWRHALWFLVVLRLALPVTLESPISMFNWFSLHNAVASPRLTQDEFPAPQTSSNLPDAVEEASVETPEAKTGSAGVVAIQSPAQVAFLIWLAGAVALPICLLVKTYQLGRRVKGKRPVTDTAVLNLLEDCKQEMGVTTPLLLVETPAVASPSLFGLVRPRLLIPPGLIQQFTPAELRYVFLHELGHVKRGDIAMNWIATASLVVHWFNPLVWLAVNQMRADRELACDELALSLTRETENKSYGQTIIKLLEHFSHSAAAPSLVGILETRNQMRRRINMIATFKKSNRWPALAAGVFAALAVVTLTDAQTSPPPARASAPIDREGPPEVVSISPSIGATEVDAGTKEITVTFDRDMQGGYSWTGGGPEYPPTAEGQKAHWRDKRTCVLPVKLERARFYRVGINSKSFQNFRSVEGVSSRPFAIYFTTEGASEELKLKTVKPKIVAVNPAHGATDVDPGLTQITVTFNIPMGAGFSWTGDEASVPKLPEGKRIHWTEDKKTCVRPVELMPNREYTMGLNSEWYNNFQSEAGVPLDPHTLSFRTRP
jgi:beta-lactamase regulating signal transducer with metallopeptidase domain